MRVGFSLPSILFLFTGFQFRDTRSESKAAPHCFFIMMTTDSTKKRSDFYWKWVERPRRILGRIFGGRKRYWAAHSLPREMKKLRGHLALDTFEVVRILGWTDQYEEDIYWIVLTRRPGVGVAVNLMSACGGFTPLRNKISTFDYWHTLYLWDLNEATVERGMQICAEQNIKVL